MLGVCIGSSGSGELVQLLRPHANPDKAVFYLDSVSPLLSGCRSQWATELGNGSEEKGLEFQHRALVSVRQGLFKVYSSTKSCCCVDLRHRQADQGSRLF